MPAPHVGYTNAQVPSVRQAVGSNPGTVRRYRFAATLQRKEEEREPLRKAEMAQVPGLSLPKRPNRHPPKEEIAEREPLIQEWKTLVGKGYFTAAGTGSEVPP